LSVLAIMGVTLSGCSYEHHKTRDPGMEMSTPSLLKQDKQKHDAAYVSTPVTRDEGMVLTSSSFRPAKVGPDAVLIQAPDADGVIKTQMLGQPGSGPAVTLPGAETMPQQFTPVIDDSYPRSSR